MVATLVDGTYPDFPDISARTGYRICPHAMELYAGAGKSYMTGDDIDEISHRIMVELETASSKDLSEARYAKKILELSDLNYTKDIFHEIDSVPSGAERLIEKRAVIKALLLSTWMQRLYFIIRSALMSVLAMVVTFFYVSFFGQIGVLLAVLMGVLIFSAGLIVTRLFDTQTIRLTKYIVRKLANHKKIRDFVMNHL